MKNIYKIQITNRGESLKYTDSSGSIYFNAIPNKDVWEVSLLCYKGDNPHPEKLTDIENTTIVPRLKEFIESKKRFGLFGKNI